ncbi:MAG: YciI family protein [Pseudomonadota bacterium]|nr:YciI family protein [Pseudomonadota bacterium]
MHFVIFCIDKLGITRDPQVMKAHVEYLESSKIKNVISGPLTDDSGQNVIGSLYIVEAASRQDIDEFQQKDPLAQANYWESIEIRAFDKRVDNRH